MTTLLLLGLIILGGFLLTALVLWQGTRLAGAARASFGRAFLTLLTVTAGLVGGGAVFEAWQPIDSTVPLRVYFCMLLAGMAGLLWLWLVTRLLLCTTTAQVVYAWLPTLITCLAILGVLDFFVRPHVLEADYLRSNSMAPTLLAVHHEGTCPHCGGTAFVPFTLTSIENETPTDRQGICGACRRLGRITDTGAEVLWADRYMVNKLLTPQRWDLVLYRDPTRTGNRVRFVKRLVGLPGEEIIIRAGGVWANGQRLELPKELEGLEFTNKQYDDRPILWGTDENPARLGPDEFFVLDDFTVRSNDSRMWRLEVNGRPAYALPSSAVEGVVAYRYWPYERFQIFR